MRCSPTVVPLSHVPTLAHAPHPRTDPDARSSRITSASRGTETFPCTAGLAHRAPGTRVVGVDDARAKWRGDHRHVIGAFFWTNSARSQCDGLVVAICAGVVALGVSGRSYRAHAGVSRYPRPLRQLRSGAPRNRRVVPSLGRHPPRPRTRPRRPCHAWQWTPAKRNPFVAQYAISAALSAHVFITRPARPSF